MRSCDYAVLTLGEPILRERYFKIFPSYWAQLLTQVTIAGFSLSRPLRGEGVFEQC